MSGFEETLQDWYSHDDWQFADRGAAYKYFYNVGVAAERERCARLAETQFCCDDGEEELIATAIRRG
jgi:hypothetical protein